MKGLKKVYILSYFDGIAEMLEKWEKLGIKIIILPKGIEVNSGISRCFKTQGYKIASDKETLELLGDVIEKQTERNFFIPKDIISKVEETCKPVQECIDGDSIEPLLRRNYEEEI